MDAGSCLLRFLLLVQLSIPNLSAGWKIFFHSKMFMMEGSMSSVISQSRAATTLDLDFLNLKRVWREHGFTRVAIMNFVAADSSGFSNPSQSSSIYPDPHRPYKLA